LSKQQEKYAKEVRARQIHGTSVATDVPDRMPPPVARAALWMLILFY
jgi:hypothetical protein